MHCPPLFSQRLKVSSTKPKRLRTILDSAGSLQQIFLRMLSLPRARRALSPEGEVLCKLSSSKFGWQQAKVLFHSHSEICSCAVLIASDPAIVHTLYSASWNSFHHENIREFGIVVFDEAVSNAQYDVIRISVLGILAHQGMTDTTSLSGRILMSGNSSAFQSKRLAAYGLSVANYGQISKSCNKGSLAGAAVPLLMSGNALRNNTCGMVTDNRHFIPTNTPADKRQLLILGGTYYN